ncbi:M1 family aminopeptidase [Myxococcaceae bacterium GXIMD 01537]
MDVLVLVAVFGAMGCSEDATPLEVPEDATGFRVERYAHRLMLETGALESELILAVEVPGGRCLTLASALPVAWARWDGVEAQATHDSATRSLRVCGPGTSGGALRLGFGLTLPEGRDSATRATFLRQRDASGHRFSFLSPWLEGCAAFGPCEPAVDRLTDWELTVEHRAEDTVLCGGEREVSEGRTRCLIRGAPAYSAWTVSAYPAWEAVPWLREEGTQVVLFTPPHEPLAPRLDAAAVRGALRSYTALLGPLPYGPELRVGVGPIPWLGFEVPGNVLLSDDIGTARSDYANLPLHTLLHELAHQWAGNRTTLASPRDVVWKEAIAEYLAYVAEEELRPGSEASATRRAWNSAGRFAVYWPRPLDEPAPPTEALLHVGYGAGPMALFLQLEPYLGRRGVLDGIRRFLAEPGTRGTGELRGALEAAAGGVSLARYWASWVEGRGEPPRPQFAVETVGDIVTVRQVQDAEPMPCEVEVEVRGVSGARRRVVARFDLQAPQRELTLSLGLGEPVEGVQVDPEERVLDWPVLP